MNNEFIKAVKEACNKGYCIKMFCTTCGCREFRQMLQDIDKNSLTNEKLANALSQIEPQELTKLKNWGDALRIALADIFNLHIAEIMVNWLDIMDESIIFTDYVTYYIVRGLSKDSQLWIDWIDKGIVIAQNTKHESFIESLVWTISDRMNDYSEFQIYCIKFANDSKKLQIALRKSCGIDL
jgi:hypothetical protein